MSKKHKGQKAFFREFTHEMFRKTAIDNCLERVRHYDVPGKIKYLEGYNSSGVITDDQLREITQRIYQTLDKITMSSEFYRCIDAWFLAALNFKTTIDEVVFNIVVRLCEQVFAYPGFIDDQRVKHIETFHKYIRGHWSLMSLIYEWISTGKFVYKLSRPLAEMLKCTKLDKIPISLVRLPQSTIYISPPRGTWPEFKVFSDTEIGQDLSEWQGVDTTSFANADGVTIMEYNEPTRFWQFTVLREDVRNESNTTIAMKAMWTLTFSDNPEETVADVIARTKLDRKDAFTESWSKAAREILEYLLAVVIYLTVKDSDKIFAEDSPQYAAWVKELQQAKLSRKQERLLKQQLDTVTGARHCYLGGSIKIDRHAGVEPLPEEQVKGTHASPKSHWRSGHFRGVWKGPKETQHSENVWIKPVIVNLGKDTVAAKQRIVT